MTDLQSGANQTDVRIGWQAVQPEGPGPAVYTVTYSNGQTSGAVPGCQKLASLTCTHSGLPYDGLTYTYRVVAANQPPGEPGNRSAPSEGGTVALVGRPAAWADWSVAPTGTSQEVQVTYTVPDSRGTVSNVDILVSGVAQASPNQTGTDTVRVPHAGQRAGLHRRAAGVQREGARRLHAERREAAQSYGPLGDALGEIRPVVNGKNVYWVITGTANGSPVSVRYELDGDNNGAIEIRPGVTGQFSVQTRTYTTASFNQDIRVSVASSTPSGRRAARTRGRTGRSPAPARARGQHRARPGSGDVRAPRGRAGPAPASRLPGQQLQHHPARDRGLPGELHLLGGRARSQPDSGNPGLQTVQPAGTGSRPSGTPRAAP